MKYVLVFLLSLAPAFSYADIVSDLQIKPDGTFSGKNLTVVQVAGKNVFGRATWGQAFVRITMLMNASTTVKKAHGEPAEIRDIAEGDLLDVEGALVSGADSVMINAKTVRDISLEKTGKTISGTVTSINYNGLVFVVGRNSASTTVQVSASTPLKKGVRSIEFATIKSGDTVSAVEGVYDYRTNTLSASRVEIYQDTKVFAPRNFEGVLKTTSSSLPATLTVSVGEKEYTVSLQANATILNKAKSKTALSRFVVGDTVRFFGSIRQSNMSEIDADTVRDLAF